MVEASFGVFREKALIGGDKSADERQAHLSAVSVTAEYQIGRTSAVLFKLLRLVSKQNGKAVGADIFHDLGEIFSAQAVVVQPDKGEGAFAYIDLSCFVLQKDCAAVFDTFRKLGELIAVKGVLVISRDVVSRAELGGFFAKTHGNADIRAVAVCDVARDYDDVGFAPFDLINEPRVIFAEACVVQIGDMHDFKAVEFLRQPVAAIGIVSDRQPFVVDEAENAQEDERENNYQHFISGEFYFSEDLQADRSFSKNFDAAKYY